MKRFLLALALVAAAGETCVATAPGSQTASPTAAQFKALKKQVTKLQKDEKLVKSLAFAEAQIITSCMAGAVPIRSEERRVGKASRSRWTSDQSNKNSGQPLLDTARE